MLGHSQSENIAPNISVANSVPKMKDKSNVPWVEKYRPRSVVDIVSQTEAVLFFKKVMETGDFPNLLLYGPPGTGKTSSILALARDLFGPHEFKNRVLELNASDERGIQVIRDKVKSFARLTVAETINNSNGRTLPPYKLIIMDESDNMTSTAQAALRRMMETCINTTRFCLICNYITKIIEPLISRCSTFYFQSLKLEDSLSCLRKINETESLYLSDDNLKFIIKASDGDLRKAVMFVQSCRYMSNSNVSPQILSDICGVVPKSFADKVIERILSGSIDQLMEIATEFVASGYSMCRFLGQLLERILSWKKLNDIDRSRLLIKLSEIDRNLSDGADEYLQLLNFLSYTHQTIYTS